MSRLKSRRTAVASTPYERPPLPRKRGYVQSGRGAFDDAYPLPGDRDHRALLAEQLRHDRELTDLPDVSADAFGSDEEYALWLAEGAQRFSA